MNGMLHSDEKVGMREIANQLCAAGDELLFSRTAGFMENIGFMREVLRILEQGGRAVIFVLEAFDLFAKGGAKSKQTLLYAVMDLLQQNQVQAAVVGVTSRHDAVEMLEKRVRSRFSFRRILLAPPVSDVRAVDLLKAALRLEDSSTTGSTGSTKTVPVSTTISTTNSGVPVSTGTVPVSTTGSTVTSTTTTTCPVSIFPPDPTYAVRFNQALDAALLTPAAVACITRFEQLECTPRSVGDLALVVLSRFDRNVGLITARDILYATNTLLADTYVKSLAGSSVLELCLVVAMSRLRRFRNLTNFNLNHVENELRSMAANDFLGDAGRAKGPVLLRAFEGLLAMGMCECQNAGGGQGGSHIGTGNRPGNRPGAAGVHKHFRGITKHLTSRHLRQVPGRLLSPGAVFSRRHVPFAPVPEPNEFQPEPRGERAAKHGGERLSRRRGPRERPGSSKSLRRTPRDGDVRVSECWGGSGGESHRHRKQTRKQTRRCGRAQTLPRHNASGHGRRSGRGGAFAPAETSGAHGTFNPRGRTRGDGVLSSTGVRERVCRVNKALPCRYLGFNN